MIFYDMLCNPEHNLARAKQEKIFLLEKPGFLSELFGLSVSTIN